MFDEERTGGGPACAPSLAAVGLLYLADRADTGLHIVELTGTAAATLDAPD